MAIENGSRLERFGRRLRLGMVGGGLDSVIGPVHRVALRTDGCFELVAGAMSIDPAIARASGAADLIDPSRSYPDYQTMLADELARDDGIDVVVIATPPQTHATIASAFLDAGIDVLCEKPFSRDLEDAAECYAHAEQSDAVLAIAHCYSGYPMVREARALVAGGAIGPITMVDGEFAMDYPGPADTQPVDGHWRWNPASAGRAAILGEVGSHAHHLLEYVTGARVDAVSARLDILHAGRAVYDNAYLNVTMRGGVVGRLWSSYVASGSEHGLAFRVYGRDGALHWRQEEPEVLWHVQRGGATTKLTRAGDASSPLMAASCRFPRGHAEGYGLAFANLYRDLADAAIARRLGEAATEALDRLPDATDGLSTMRLIVAAERSHHRGGQWVGLDAANGTPSGAEPAGVLESPPS